MLLVGALAGTLLGVAGAQPALALDGQIPDAGLAQCINKKIDPARAVDRVITIDEVKNLRGVLTCNADTQSNAAPIRSLDGLGPAGISGLAFTSGVADLGAPAALADLPQLTKLTQLNFYGANVTDASLVHIGNATKLERLELRENPAITTLQPIAPLVNLTSIDLQNAPTAPGVLTSLAGIEGMTKLKSILTTFTGIRSTAPLAGKPGLETVAMSSNALTDVDGLADAKKLKVLLLSENPGIEGRLDVLAGNTLLREVRLDNTGATNLRFLDGANSIQVLEARRNAISTLDKVAPLEGSSVNVSGQLVTVPDTFFVPAEATEFRFSAAGHLAMRDGSFPDVSGVSVVASQAPVLETSVAQGDRAGSYDFAGVLSAKQYFRGSVHLNFDRVALDVSKVPTFALAGDEYSGEPFVANVTRGGAAEPGFAVTRYELSDDAPKWLSIDATTGKVTGVPTHDESVSYTVRAYDGLDNVVSAQVTVGVESRPTITLEGGLPAGTVGSKYTETIVTAVGTPVLKWAATGLPAGLTIDPATGAISGTPTESGTFSVNVTVTNAHGVATADYKIVVAEKGATVVPGGPGKPGGAANDPLSQTGGSPVAPLFAAGILALGAGALMLSRRQRNRSEA